MSCASSIASPTLYGGFFIGPIIHNDHSIFAIIRTNNNNAFETIGNGSINCGFGSSGIRIAIGDGGSGVALI